MSDAHSIAKARSRLSALVREAEAGKAVELTRRGEPVAVLVGIAEFERLAAGRRGLADACRRFREAVDLEALRIDPDELFGDARDRSPGRAVGHGGSASCWTPPWLRSRCERGSRRA